MGKAVADAEVIAALRDGLGDRALAQHQVRR